MASTASGKSNRARRGASTVMSEIAAARLSDTAPIMMPPATMGRIAAITAEGVVSISVAGQAPIEALVLEQVSSVQLIHARDHAEPVLVTFPDGDAGRPVIIGVVVSAAPLLHRSATATIDGRRVEITGHDEVVLTCGEASITLTKAGKILIKGLYVLTAANGVNRITGGSVKIN